MKHEKEIIEFHRQRIADIDKGLLDHLGKSYAAKLRRQSEYIINHPCYGYSPEN